MRWAHIVSLHEIGHVVTEKYGQILDECFVEPILKTEIEKASAHYRKKFHLAVLSDESDLFAYEALADAYALYIIGELHRKKYPSLHTWLVNT